MKKRMRLATYIGLLLLLGTAVVYNGCKKPNIEPENGEDKIGATEFEDGGGDDLSLVVNPLPIECDALFNSLPEHSTDEIYENLDLLARIMTVMSNDDALIPIVNDQVGLQFDTDFNVLFRDLAIACGQGGLGLPDECLAITERFFPAEVPVILPRAQEFRYHWDDDVIYPQVFIPFYETVDLSKHPIIAVLQSEDDVDAEVLNGYQLIFDNDDTDGLTELIASGASNGSIKNALLEASPLSDEVLLAALAAGLPNGHIQQIMQANAPYSQVVEDAINAAGLPNGITNQILNAPDVVKLTELVVDEALAQTCPVWIISFNESVNCAGGFEGVKQITAPQVQACTSVNPEKRWFEFYEHIKFPCRKESWISGKADVNYSWVRYNPSNNDWCEYEADERLVRNTDGDWKVSKSQVCEELEVHHEFCNSTWGDLDRIALLVFEKDIVSKDPWDWSGFGDIIFFKSKQVPYFQRDETFGPGGFQWINYPTPGQWGGTMTPHFMNCDADDCDKEVNSTTCDCNGVNHLELRGGKQGA